MERKAITVYMMRAGVWSSFLLVQIEIDDPAGEEVNMMADEEIGTGQDCCQAEDAESVEETAETEQPGGEEPAQGE